MPRLVEREALDSFDSEHISIIEDAIDRAWSVIKFTEDMQPEEEARKVLALCVMSEVRQGKINRVLLINRAIRSYWAQRAKLVALNKVGKFLPI
jgi:hypothetical protein